MNYKEKKQLFESEFYLGKCGDSIENKIILISLICSMTNELKLKKPDWDNYQTIKSLTKNIVLTEDLIINLSLFCDAFSYGCSSFIDLGFKTFKEKVAHCQMCLRNLLPF